MIVRWRNTSALANAADRVRLEAERAEIESQRQPVVRLVQSSRMARYFTLEQAQGLLPEVGTQLRKAMESHKRNQESEAELAQLTRRVAMAGGMQIDPEQTRRLKRNREAAATQLAEAVESITELGVQIKDIEIGLIDFPTLFKGREVLLCWKIGEPRIQFWHGLEEGFRGRKKIDREFMDQHRGDEAQ